MNKIISMIMAVSVDSSVIVAICCFTGAAILMVVAVGILVATFRNKPGGKAAQKAVREKKPAKAAKEKKVKAEHSFAAAYSDDETEVVRQPVSNGIIYELRLISLNDLNQTWTYNVSGEILAGRAEYASIRFGDKSVSREQFRIISTASGLAVVHCGSTNKTTVNDQLADKPVIIKSGDVIKFGREAVRVEYVQPYSSQSCYDSAPETEADWQPPTITETQHWVKH